MLISISICLSDSDYDQHIVISTTTARQRQPN